jgi:hypothetical protein
MDTMEFLRGLSEENLAALPHMIKAEQQHRFDQKQVERIVNHQCTTYEEINRCPICSIP